MNIRWCDIPLRKTAIFIILLLAAAWYFSGPQAPTGSAPQYAEKVLVLGNTSTATASFLQTRFGFEEHSVQELDYDTTLLRDADIVLLDQTSSSSKTISENAGNALRDWVRNGGMLVIVQDSGTRNENEIVEGWQWLKEATPVSCPSGRHGFNPTPPICTQATIATGKIRIQLAHSTVLQGIPISELEATHSFQITPVQVEGTELLDIKTTTGAVHHGLTEQRVNRGLVRHFAFQPTRYPTLFENALRNI